MNQLLKIPHKSTRLISVIEPRNGCPKHCTHILQQLCRYCQVGQCLPKYVIIDCFPTKKEVI